MFQLIVIFFYSFTLVKCNEYQDVMFFESVKEVTRHRCEIKKCEYYSCSLGPPVKEQHVMSHSNRRYGYRYNYDDEPELEVLEVDCQIITISNDVHLKINMFENASYTLGINLTDTSLNDLQQGVFNYLGYLQELYLSYNNLTTIKEGIFNLLNLRILTLNNNQIKTLANNSFENLNVLFYLDLSNNYISFLPKHIFDSLGHLEALNISNNPLKNVDMLSLNLIQLCVSNLNIFKIDKQNSSFLLSLFNKNVSFLLKFERLELLDLSHNNISEILTLKNVASSLIELNLSFNNIGENSSDLPTDLFHSFYNLEKLDLSMNKLKRIQFGLFERAPNLKYLNLSHNEIVDFNYHSYESKGFIVLDLRYNNLVTVDVKYWPKITLLYLDHNKWQCNKLQSIMTMLETKKIYIVFGTSHMTENINKISCNNTKYVEIPEDIDGSKLKNNIANDISKLNINQTYLNDFYNKDFLNSSFYKFFTGFNYTNVQNGSLLPQHFPIENLTKSLNGLFIKFENNSDQLFFHLNATLFEHLNGFDENFAKFMNSFQNHLINSNFANFVNTDFENSSFNRYLNSFNNLQPNYAEKSTASKLVAPTNINNNSFRGFYAFACFNLLLLIVLIGMFAYFLYFIKINQRNIENNLQLI